MPNFFDDDDELGGGALGQLTPAQLAMPDDMREYLRRSQEMVKSASGAMDRYEQETVGALGAGRDAAAASAAQKTAVLQRALDAILAQKPDHTATLLAMASGFLKPTRTGRFGESLGQAGEAAVVPMLDERKRTDARQLKEIDYRLAQAGIEGEAEKARFGTEGDIAKTRYAAALKRLEEGRKGSSDVLRLEQLRRTLAMRQAGAAATQQRHEDKMAQGKVDRVELSLSEEEAAALGMKPGPGVFLVDKTSNEITKRLGDIVTAETKKGATKLTPVLQQAEAEDLGVMQTAEGINMQLDGMLGKIDDGTLDLGFFKNWIDRSKNVVGISSQQSRSLASFEATLEKMRNDSLRLNKGVQTEGDAQRAWNELLKNINDKDLVRQRLEEIKVLNERAVAYREEIIQGRREAQGVGPWERKKADDGGWKIEKQ